MVVKILFDRTHIYTRTHPHTHSHTLALIEMSDPNQKCIGLSGLRHVWTECVQFDDAARSIYSIVGTVKMHLFGIQKFFVPIVFHNEHETVQNQFSDPDCAYFYASIERIVTN